MDQVPAEIIEQTEQPQEELLKPIRLNFQLNGKLLLPVDVSPSL